MLSKESRGVLLVLSTALISGLAVFLNKVGVEGVNPYLFTGAKNFFVAIFLFLTIIATGKLKTLSSLSFRNWLVLALIGLIGGSLPFLLFFRGLSLTNALQASFIHKNMFLGVIFLAPFFLKERIEKKFFLAAIILLTGNALFFRTFSLSFNQGSFLIVLATFFWVLENIISKRALKSLPAQIVAFGRMFFGTVFITIFLIITNQISLLSQLTRPQISWVIVTSIFLLGYVITWYSGLKAIKVSLATSILTLGAPVTSILSYVFLGILPASDQMAGGLLLFLGFLLAVRLRRFLGREKSIYVRA